MLLKNFIGCSCSDDMTALSVQAANPTFVFMEAQAQGETRQFSKLTDMDTKGIRQKVIFSLFHISHMFPKIQF